MKLYAKLHVTARKKINPLIMLMTFFDSFNAASASNIFSYIKGLNSPNLLHRLFGVIGKKTCEEPHRYTLSICFVVELDLPYCNFILQVK